MRSSREAAASHGRPVCVASSTSSVDASTEASTRLTSGRRRARRSSRAAALRCSVLLGRRDGRRARARRRQCAERLALSMASSRWGLASGAALSSAPATGDGDGFESGVDAEGPEESADVVPDCLGTQVEFGGDLLCRAALFQKAKHLDLTRGELRVWRCVCRRGVPRSARRRRQPVHRS